MKKTLMAVLGAAFLMVGCASEDTRNRTVTPEETREAGADALNTRGTGEDKDLVGTDSANSPWKDDVKQDAREDEATKNNTTENNRNTGKK